MYFDANDFGHRVKVLRERQGLTQEEMAGKLGISLNHVGYIERGLRTPSIDLCIEFSELFGVSLDYLMLGKGIQLNTKEIKQELLFLTERMMALEKLI